MANERPVQVPPEPHQPPLPRREEVYGRLEKHREALRAVVREMERITPGGSRIVIKRRVVSAPDVIEGTPTAAGTGLSSSLGSSWSGGRVAEGTGLLNRHRG